MAQGRVLAWALYDWANSAFATTIMAGFFPLFFSAYWHPEGTDPSVSTLHLGWANSLGSLVVAALAPLLGSIADRGSRRKRFLVIFAFLGALSTAALFTVARGQWLWAAVLYVIAGIGFAGGNIFYDALLIGVAPPEKRDRVSALGFGLGYLGGGVLFAANVFMVLKPEIFGLPDKSVAIRVAFLSVAVWWTVFALPLMLWVPEPATTERCGLLQACRDGVAQLVHTARQLRRLRQAGIFLLAYWLYIDGVDTVIRMAVDYGKSLEFSDNALITALLITQFVGFPAALGFGWLGSRFGARRAIFVGIGVYAAVCCWAFFMRQESEFYVLAVVVGLVQGGVQALSRSYYSRIIPPSQAGEFFGFYNMLGKSAAIIGPPLMGLVAAGTAALGAPTDLSRRLPMLSLLILFGAGAYLLSRVDEQQAAEQVAALEAEG